jgi:hypothetical protein
MRDSDDNDSRFENAHCRIWKGADEHTADSFGYATVKPWRSEERHLVDTCEGGLYFSQEAIAQPGDTVVVPNCGLSHFRRSGAQDLSHDEPTIERELRPSPPPS